MDPGVTIAVALAGVTCAVVCFQKGKVVFGFFGLAAVAPVLAPLAVFAVIGAFRIAKPSSAWAEARYSPLEMEAARRRFADDAPAVWEGEVEKAEVGSTPAGRSSEWSLSNRLLLLRFLREAADAGVISEEDRLRLTEFAEEGRRVTASEASPALTSPEVPAEKQQPSLSDSGSPSFPTETEPPGEVGPLEERPSPPGEPVPVVGPIPHTPPTPSPESAPRTERPVSPLTQLASFGARTWDAIASDVALHGFAYLGVILTFIGVLGFLLFAFTDLPNEIQPFVELGIAFIFFGWAWLLRRQRADRVADAMELIGGMVLPLVVFASLVDGAPFPPDVTGVGVVVALPIASLAMAGVYSWVAFRNPESTLRYLVGPLIWLAAMSLGFMFKTDEPLFSDAITRLVSPQPALASAAVAATLVACLALPGQRLASPTVRSALIGAPAAYLLTISLAVGEDWALTWPVAALGGATLISAEVFAIWFDRRAWMAIARPMLVAGVLGPLVPTIGLEWGSVVVSSAYVVVYELERKRRSGSVAGAALALTGVAVGLAMSVSAPWATLVSFTLIWSWSHLRRRREDDESFLQIFTVGAVVLPAGLFYGLLGLWGLATALVTIAALLTALSLYVRLSASEDSFWFYWLLFAALATGIGAWTQWYEVGLDGYRSAAALALVAVAIALIPRWPVLRTWVAAASTAAALSVLLVEMGSSAMTQEVIWASAGLASVAAANLWRRVPGSHLAAIGHAVGTGSAISVVVRGGDAAFVLGAWALGWLLTAIGDERGGDTLTGLLTRAVSGDTGGDFSVLRRLVGWLVPALLTFSIPLAVLSAANRWDEFAAHRSWSGALLVTVGIAYTMGVQVVGPRRELRRALGAGAVALAVIGVSVAAPDSWPTIYAAAGVVAVAALLSGDLRQTWFVWFAWSMTVVIVLLLARQAGVPADSRHLISLAWGAGMLVGGLIFDDVRSGRRIQGEGLRTGWLRYPVLLGALVFPMSLGPAFAGGLDAAATWALASAAIYGGTAYLMRVGAVTAPAYALAAVGVTGLWQGPITDDPWLFAFLAGPLVGLSWVLERTKGDGARGWLGWDVPPLVVAHGIAVVALLFAAVGGGLAPTGLAFGAISVAVGLWKRGRVWEEAGNLMILVAALDLGPGWLTLALGLTSVRGMIGVRLSSGTSRISYQLLATAGAGLGWVSYLFWSDLAALDASGYSIAFWGALALTVAVIYRAKQAMQDSAFWWLGLSTLGAAVTAVVTLLPVGPGIEGLWFASGLVLLGAGIELAADRDDVILRATSVSTVGAAWGALLAGLGWDAPVSLDYTALVFGAGAFVAAQLGRFDLVRSDNASRWGGLGVVGVIAALLASGRGWAGVMFEGPEVAIGVALVALAFETAWRFTDFGFRYAAVGAAATSWFVLVLGLGWSAQTTAIWTSLVFGLGVVLVPELARAWLGGGSRSRPDPRVVELVRSWAALGGIGVISGAALSYAGEDLRVSGFWVAGSLALLAIAAARGAAPLRLSFLREVSPVIALASLITYAYTASWSDTLVATITILLATVVTLLALLVWHRRAESLWIRPLTVLASVANLVASAIAIALLPDLTQVVGVLLSIGIQALAVGLAREDPTVLAVGPPLLGLGFILAVGESVGGSALWFTSPIGLVLLSEVEIFRTLGGDRSVGDRRDLISFLEWLGLAILSAPPLVEMFTVSLYMGLAGVGVAVAVFVWGVATKLRRRVVSAAALAIATMVLLLFAAAAGTAPTSAFLWIVAIGVGSAVLLVAGFVEAYRSKRGKTMARFDVLMEGWE